MPEAGEVLKSNEELIEFLRQQGFADEATAEAMLANPREDFVPEEQKPYAYFDTPLPIGFGQTISAPSMVAEITRLAQVKPGMKLLEVGAGSGWQAAILAFLAGKKGRVYTTERIFELASFARRNIDAKGYGNAEVICADGSAGLPEQAPFDRIIVSAAAPQVPPPLVSQLKEGGRLLIPVGSSFCQDLVVIEKIKGKPIQAASLPVVFVPLIGEYGFRPG